MVTKNTSACICGCGTATTPDRGGVYMHPECAAKIRAAYTAEAGIPNANLSAFEHGIQYAQEIGGNLAAHVASLAKTATSYTGHTRNGADAFLFGVASVAQERAA